MSKKVEPTLIKVSALKPGDIIGLAKYDATVLDVNTTGKDDGKHVESLVTVKYIPCHVAGDDEKAIKKNTKELTAFNTDGVAAYVELIPARQTWWSKFMQKESA